MHQCSNATWRNETAPVRQRKVSRKSMGQVCIEWRWSADKLCRCDHKVCVLQNILKECAR